MDWLPKKVLDDLSVKYDEVERLMALKDRESEPYKSKYAARDLLHQMADAVKDQINETQVHASAIGAAVYSAIGCIDMDTQELAEAETHLKTSMEVAAHVDAPDLIALTRVKTLNQLGVLWCIRDDAEKAERYLDDALRVYASFSREKDDDGCRKAAFGLKNLLTSSTVEPSFESDKAMELLNAYTYYFLAQVYQKNGKLQLSAKCCHTTLAKQLEVKEYQALDWARNAATLSHHYTVHEHFKAAKLHLAAASYVLDFYRHELDSKEFDDEEDEAAAREAFEETEADVARSWGKYALVLLETSVEQSMRGLEVEDIEEPGAELDYEVDFPSIELSPALSSDLRHLPAAHFEEARDIFLPGQRAYNRAKLHYTLNDHCCDFAEIQQDLSRMHKALVFFEPDEDRQFKMHKRRVDLLDAVYRELNRQVYRLLCRQLVFEIGETYSSMMDLKLAKHRENPSSAPLTAKVNALVELAANAFKQFVGLLKTTADEMPKTFDQDACRPALLAHFHLGRLCDKYVGIPDPSPAKIASKLESLKYFKFVVDYCQTHPEAEVLFASELAICKELVQLLPVKIQRMKLELSRAS